MHIEKSKLGSTQVQLDDTTENSSGQNAADDIFYENPAPPEPAKLDSRGEFIEKQTKPRVKAAVPSDGMVPFGGASAPLRRVPFVPAENSRNEPKLH